MDGTKFAAGWYAPSNPGCDPTTSVDALAITNGAVIVVGQFKFAYDGGTACGVPARRPPRVWSSGARPP